VSTPETPSAAGSAFGAYLLLRAVPALVAAAIITFSANHAVIVGQLVFLVYGFVIAPVFVWAAFATKLEAPARRAFVALAVSAALGAAVTAITIDQGLKAFTLTVGIWGAVSGALELFAGWTTTSKAHSRELLLMGGLTALFGLVEAVFPLNDVYAVGIFGAYAAILGVFAAIAAFSFGLGSPTKRKATS
jgi:uncharacterized membrane protein HdeD (DUF308 family)